MAKLLLFQVLAWLGIMQIVNILLDKIVIFGIWLALYEPDSIALFLSHKPKGERFILFVAPKDILSEVWHGFRWGIEGAEREFKADKAHSINEFKDLLPVYIGESEEIVYSIGKHTKIEKISFGNIFFNNKKLGQG